MNTPGIRECCKKLCIPHERQTEHAYTFKCQECGAVHIKFCVPPGELAYKMSPGVTKQLGRPVLS